MSSIMPDGNVGKHTWGDTRQQLGINGQVIKGFFSKRGGQSVCVCFTKKGGGAHTIIYPKMVNVYAIVNRDIFGVPTHLPSPTHVSVPNVVIETREAKAHAVLRTVKKNGRCKKPIRPFRAHRLNASTWNIPRDIIPRLYFAMCMWYLAVLGIDCEEPHNPINVRVLENGQNHQEGDELKCRAEFNGASPLPTSRAEEINSSPTPMWTMPFCLVSLTGQQGNNETVKFSVSFGT